MDISDCFSRTLAPSQQNAPAKSPSLLETSFETVILKILIYGNGEDSYENELTRLSSLDLESKTTLYPLYIESLDASVSSSMTPISLSLKYSFTQAASLKMYIVG